MISTNVAMVSSISSLCLSLFLHSREVRGQKDERESYQSDQVPNILYRQDDLFEMKIPVKVSSVIEDLRIEILESSPINFTTSLVLKSFIVFSAVVIFLINSSIIRWDQGTTVCLKQEHLDFLIKVTNLYRSLFSTRWTFINLLILADCSNALAHIPVILQYMW